MIISDIKSKTTEELKELLQNAIFYMLSCEDRLAISQELLDRGA